MYSMPAEIRTRPSCGRPDGAPMFGERTDAWVIDAGCEMSVSDAAQAFGER